MSRYNDLDQPVPDPAEERVTAVRVIKYEGPRAWVEQTLDRSIHGTYAVAPGKTISAETTVPPEPDYLPPGPREEIYPGWIVPNADVETCLKVLRTIVAACEQKGRHKMAGQFRRSHAILVSLCQLAAEGGQPKTDDGPRPDAVAEGGDPCSS